MVSGKSTQQSHVNFACIPPESFNLNNGENVMENWRLWKTRYEDFATLSQLSNQPMTYQMAMLHRCLGDAALKVVQTLTYDKDEDKDDVTTVMTKTGEILSW